MSIDGNTAVNVLFAGFGITPYYRDFLNRLQRQGAVRVTNVRPRGENRHLGAGVHQEFAGIEFDDIELVETIKPGRRVLGLSDFELAPPCNTFDGLATVIRERAPDAIVVNVNYHAAFTFDISVANEVRKLGSRVILHSIPFQLDTREDTLRSLNIPDGLPLKSLPRILRGTIHGLRLDRAYVKLVRRPGLRRFVDFRARVFRNADAHAVYHEGGRDIYASYGVKPDRVRVVRNSPNTEKLLAAATRHPRAQNSFRLIHVGRLVAWKRVDMLIRVVGRLRASGFSEAELTVVGYGPCEPELRELACSLQLNDAIHFRGGLYEPESLAAEYARSAVYVMAGMGGLSLNEAMCFGMPVVCSRGDGTEKFLVREGANGFFFREDDEDHLLSILSRLLADRDLQQSLGTESRRIITEELNSEVHVDNYLQLFEDLTGKPCRR